MMDNKKRIALIAGAACVILAVLVLLLGGNGGQNGGATEPSTVTEPTVPTLEQETEAAPEETTEAAESTTAPTEETTEATEETTAPTETTPPGNDTPGGTGGFEGGTTGEPDDKDDKDDEIKVKDPGTKKNPYIENLTGEFPISLTTVKIHSKDKLYYRFVNGSNTVLTIADANAYVVYDGKTYEQEGGVVTLQIPANEKNDPVTVQIGNRSGKAKVFTLTFTAPVGSQGNPQVLESIDQITVPVQASQPGGYYFIWKAAESGKLTLAVETIQPETAQCAIALSCGEKTGAATEDGTGVSMDVENGDEVIIHVTVTPQGEAADVVLAGSFEASTGSLTNPVMIVDVESGYEAQVPAGATVYYSAYLSGMTLTVENAAEAYLVIDGESILPDENGVITYEFPAAEGMGRPAPVVFGLSNSSDTDGTYSLTFAYPAGTLMNPAQLQMGENTAVIAADNTDGYNYVWTAPGNGKLTITMTGSNWQYVLNNETASTYGDLCDAGNDPSTAEAVLEVSAEDTISLMVNGFDMNDPWAYPGGTVTFHAAFDEIVGTPENPIWIQDLSVPFTAQVKAGELLYYTGYIHGVTMTAENAQGAAVILDNVTYAANDQGVLRVEFPAADGMGRPAPVVFALSNGTQTDAEYVLNFVYPEGTLNNPAQMVLGDNEAVLEANAPDGYNYVWEAADDGVLTITMSGDNWQYVVNNETAGIYGDFHLANDDPVVSSETLNVTKGDKITLMVNTYDPESWDTPAGTVAFAAAFESGMGTQTNPIVNYGQFPIVTDPIALGKSLYYSVFNAAGMSLTTDAELTVDGKSFASGSVVPGMPRTPVLIGVTNSGDTTRSFTLNFDYPLGSFNNPAALTMGQNTAVIAANSADGYIYNWTATESGLLTITMTCDHWQYVVNNETSYAYGSTHWSDEEPVAVFETIRVTAGDQISVSVNTYTPGQWDTPAGTVTFTASFAAGIGTEEKPAAVYKQDTIATPVLEAGETIHYSVYGVGGMCVELPDEGVSLTVNAEPYTPGSVIQAGPGMAVTVSVTNSSASQQAVSLGFYYPLGGYQNPDTLVMGENTAIVAPDSTDGYNFVWTAEAEGKLTVTMNGSNWQYFLNNETAGIYGDLCDASMEPSAAQSVLKVRAGDKVTLNVNGFDANDPWSLPGGTVTFTAAFEESVGTQTNPIVVQGSFPIETPAIEAGETLYYSVSGAAGMVMTVSDTDAVITVNEAAYTGGVIGGNPRQPAVITVTNSGAEAKAFVLNFGYPAGSLDNPAQLMLGENTVDVAPDNGDGYLYKWTASESGTLTITMNGDNWQYFLNNETAGIYGDLCDASQDPSTAETTVNVAAGDVISVMVNGFDASDPWSLPGGTITFAAQFTGETTGGGEGGGETGGGETGDVTETLSSETLDSYWPFISSGEIPYDGTLKLTIASVTDETGAAVDYQVNYSTSTTVNNTLSQHNGGEAVILTYEASEGSSHSWQLSASVDSSLIVTYELTYTHADMSGMPEKGTAENPRKLSNLEYTSVELAAGDADGYYYTVTADADGYLTMAAGEELNLTLTNQTTGASDSIWKTNHAGKATHASPCFVAVDKGDAVLIHISARSEGAAVYSSLYGALVEGTTAEGQGINIQNDNYIATLAPGETINFTCRFQGRNLTVYGTGFSVHNAGYDPSDYSSVDVTYTDEDGDGVMEFIPVAAGDYTDLTITNTGSVTANVELLATYALGTKQNPQIIGEGEHTLVSEKNNAGWEYAFVPTKDGVVEFKITAGSNWQYNLNGGVDRYSDDANVIASQTISVTKGENMAIFLGTYNGSSTSRPAGTISFSVRYLEDVGTETNPIRLEEGTYLNTGSIPAGGIYYYALPASAADRKMSVESVDAYVLVNGKRYETQNDWSVDVPVLPAAQNGAIVVGIGNLSGTAKSFNISILEPDGINADYAQQSESLSDGQSTTVTIDIPESFDGYYYCVNTNSSNGSGTVTVSIDGATNGWSYKLMTIEYDDMWNPVEVYGESHKSTDKDPVAEDSMSFTDWKTVYLVLDTADGKAGSVTVTITFNETAPAAAKEQAKEEAPAAAKPTEPAPAPEAEEETEPQESQQTTEPAVQETQEPQNTEAAGEPTGQEE